MIEFRNASEALVYYAGHIMKEGAEVGSRAGRTMEITHSHFALKRPWEREILVPGRLPNVAAQIAETMWVLAGRNDIEWLGHYLPRAAEFSDDGETWRAGYGPRLRNWVDNRVEEGETLTTAGRVDQLAECYRLLKTDPRTRRAVMSIWDPVVDYAESKDIPCNNWLSWSSRLGHLDLSVAIRSNDLIWGWSGVNQFEWSALLEIMAGMLGLAVGKLVFTQTSFHIYDRHWAKADAMARGDIQIGRTSPRFDWKAVPQRKDASPVDDLNRLFDYWFSLEYDIRTGSPLVQGYVDNFPEPMLRSWLRVLQWWWGGGSQHRWLDADDVYETRLFRACSPALSVQPKTHEVKAVEESIESVVDEGMGLLSEHETYADGGTCPKCNKGLLTTSGRRHPLRCVRAVCRYEPGQVLSVGEVREGAGLTLPPETAALREPSAFIQAVVALHNEKHAAYGDSWKRRGEMLGIMANVARKIDRLGKGETQDETNVDTACDLLVYLAKYRVWLDEQVEGPIFRHWGGSDTPSAANEVMLDLDRTTKGDSNVDSGTLEEMLRLDFEDLERAVTQKDSERGRLVARMAKRAYILARRLWEADNPFHDGYLGADVD